MARASGSATRERIITEATRLFAVQGIRATTVAQIEGAAGLRPGSGGLHRHFATKDDLIKAVLDAQLDRAEQDVRDAQPSPPDTEELIPYLNAVGHALLDGAERHREVALIMLREAHTLPEGMLDAHTRRNFELTYHRVAEQLRATFTTSGGRDSIDFDALAFLLVAPLVYYRIIEWATGSAILELDDDRLVSTWARCFEPVLAGMSADDAATPGSGRNFRA